MSDAVMIILEPAALLAIQNPDGSVVASPDRTICVAFCDDMRALKDRLLAAREVEGGDVSLEKFAELIYPKG